MAHCQTRAGCFGRSTCSCSARARRARRSCCSRRWLPRSPWSPPGSGACRTSCRPPKRRSCPLPTRGHSRRGCARSMVTRRRRARGPGARAGACSVTSASRLGSPATSESTSRWAEPRRPLWWVDGRVRHGAPRLPRFLCVHLRRLPRAAPAPGVARPPARRGKTTAENVARAHLRGDIIVNTDASVRIHPQALKALVTRFADPTVGVASGRDVSVTHGDPRANAGESAYVGYEMWVRDLETRVSGIVGASGCLYAVRAELHRQAVPGDLSRDFGSALLARRRGLRAVSVPEAVCFVPRGASLRQEYRRKVRTMARGLRTLWALRALLNPLRYGVFAWMLWSHKVCRWLVPGAVLVALGAVGSLAPGTPWARAALGAACGGVALAGVGGWWAARREGRPVPRCFALPAYAVSGNIAALHAWLLALSGVGTAVWEPTRRGTTAETA